MSRRQHHKGKKRPRSWHRHAPRRPERLVMEELRRDRQSRRPLTQAERIGRLLRRAER